ncbi:ribonuclease HI [bacterium]|nr:MAG: ribonuclease HI [bacterium]
MTTAAIPHVTIYTDGACKGNPGKGSWAAVLLFENVNGKVKKEISGIQMQTTNNQMELTAVIEALQCLKQPCKVTLYSDSAYIVNAFRQRWITNWQRNGWKTKTKEPVKNRELWENLLNLCARHDVTFAKVKGHAGVHYNERVDELANLALE